MIHTKKQVLWCYFINLLLCRNQVICDCWDLLFSTFCGMSGEGSSQILFDLLNSRNSAWSTEILSRNKNGDLTKTPRGIPSGMQEWKCFMLQWANYLNDKDKEVMAAKRNYSNHTYILLEVDLNVSASILKKNVWISSSQNSVDYILYLNRKMFIIKKVHLL